MIYDYGAAKYLEELNTLKALVKLLESDRDKLKEELVEVRHELNQLKEDIQNEAWEREEFDD